MSLDSVIGTADTIRSRLASSPYRRLSDSREVEIRTAMLCQSLHVNRLVGEPIRLLGDEAEGYWMHSVDSVGRVLEELDALGIRRVYLGFIAESPGLAPRKALDAFVQIVERVRRATGSSFQLIVDPAGLCMRQDLRWGVTAQGGDIDVEGTAELLAQAAVEFAEAGVDALMTIGRLNCEVEVVRKALSRCSRRVEVMSFSTNSETTSAYFDKTRNDITLARTGQKILVGNGHEMTLRALGDFGDGADVIIQKPIEATHNLVMLRMLAAGQMSLSRYIEGTTEVRRLLDAHAWMRPAIDLAATALASGARPMRTGGYEVSGTYCIVHSLSKEYSNQLAWSMLDEVYRNLACAAGGTLDVIIARSASWYARQKIHFQ